MYKNILINYLYLLKQVRGLSRIKADYNTYWTNAYSRTSTLILVDYDDNVEYYEYNLTDWSRLNLSDLDSQEWQMNSFKFKLKPFYSRNEGSSSSIQIIRNNASRKIFALVGFFFGWHFHSGFVNI